MKYVREHRFNFVGGYCTAYLMRGNGGLFVHTITRLDGGCFIKTNPVPVGAVSAKMVLKTTAESVPLR